MNLADGGGDVSDVKEFVVSCESVLLVGHDEREDGGDGEKTGTLGQAENKQI